MTATASAASARPANTSDGRPNRFAGPCVICNVYVPARAGVLRWDGEQPYPYKVLCAAHANGRGAGSPPPSTPANAAPAGERPACSERTALASVALVRHGMRPGASAESLAVAVELARLAIWASGSAQAASLLAMVLEPASAPEPARAPRSEPRGVGADLVGEILDRSQAPASGTIAANADPDRTPVRSAGEDAGWLIFDDGMALDRVMVRGLGELSIMREHGKFYARRDAAILAVGRFDRRSRSGTLTWEAERMGAVESSRMLAVLDAWDRERVRAGASVGSVVIDDSDDPIDAGAAIPTPRTVVAPRKPAGMGRARGEQAPASTRTRGGSRWAHLKKQ